MAVCGVSQTSAIIMIKKEEIHEQKTGIKTANINLIRFHSNHSAIVAGLKTLSKQATEMVPYLVDMAVLAI